MAFFLDCCRFIPASNGTGSFVVASAAGGYQTPASANAVDGATYRYRAESADITQREVGTGVYTVSTVRLTLRHRGRQGDRAEGLALHQAKRCVRARVLGSGKAERRRTVRRSLV
jgi:hypothetical protein